MVAIVTVEQTIINVRPKQFNAYHVCYSKTEKFDLLHNSFFIIL